MNAPRFEPAPAVLDTLGHTHTAYRLTPGYDPSLAYGIVVPKPWGVAKRLTAAPGAPGRPERIGYFVSPYHDPHTSITVSATRLAWEVDPLEWVAARWTVAGWSVVHRHRLDEARFEVGALFSIDGEVRVRRTTGFAADGRVVRVDVDAPLRQWEGMHDALWPSGKFFALESGAPDDRIEASLAREGALVSFRTPRSWDAHHDGGNAHDGVTWTLWSDDGVQRGFVLHVLASVSSATVEARRQQCLRKLATSGIVLETALGELPPPRTPVEGLLGNWIAHANCGREPLEVRIAHRDIGGVQADVVMVAPRPGAHHLDWLRATRGQELVSASLTADPGLRNAS